MTTKRETWRDVKAAFGRCVVFYIIYVYRFQSSIAMRLFLLVLHITHEWPDRSLEYKIILAWFHINVYISPIPIQSTRFLIAAFDLMASLCRTRRYLNELPGARYTMLFTTCCTFERFLHTPRHFFPLMHLINSIHFTHNFIYAFQPF